MHEYSHQRMCICTTDSLASLFQTFISLHQPKHHRRCFIRDLVTWHGVSQRLGFPLLYHTYIYVITKVYIPTTTTPRFHTNAHSPACLLSFISFILLHVRVERVVAGKRKRTTHSPLSRTGCTQCVCVFICLYQIHVHAGLSMNRRYVKVSLRGLQYTRLLNKQLVLSRQSPN